MWFITVIQNLRPDKKYYCLYDDTRTWGYCKDKNVAFEILHENRTDIWEGIYEYAVLEKMGEGICPAVQEEIWFKYDQKRKGYFEIETPDCVKHITNWGIG